jgi:uncharacterized tellurite resistance protein B-like protein
MYFNNAMTANATIAQLYYLFIHADGEVDHKEVEMGKLLIKMERLNGELFNKELTKLELEVVDKDQLFKDCVAVLKKLEVKVQIRYIAWMCLIANSDGFMDKEEWKLVYKFYHTELKLSHDLLLAEQKHIQQQITELNKGVA